VKWPLALALVALFVLGGCVSQAEDRGAAAAWEGGWEAHVVSLAGEGHTTQPPPLQIPGERPEVVVGEDGANPLCPSGKVLEDGLCVDGEALHQLQGEVGGDNTTQSGSWEDGEGDRESEEEGDLEGEGSGGITAEEVEALLQRVPGGLREEVEDFIGSEEDFAELLKDLEEAGDNTTQLWEGLEGALQRDALLRDVTIGRKWSWVGELFSPSNVVVGLLGAFQMVRKSTYSEEDHRIERLETVWAGNERKLSVYFTSPAALYTYVALHPLTVFIDEDNDGEWDARYNVDYDRERGKAFYYVKRRGDPYMASKPLEYSPSSSRISFSLKGLAGDRAYIWVGEEATGLRYPKKNNLVVFLENGRMEKNVAPYLVVLVDKLKVAEDGDAFQEGEVFLSNLMLFSWPLERVKAPEAEALLEYRERGLVGEKEVPRWFAYWLLRGGGGEGVELQRTSFPMVRWVEMDDGDEIFTDDADGAMSAFPAFASRREWMDSVSIVFMGTYVGDYDQWPSTITDKTGWLLAKLLGSGGGAAGELVKRLVEAMYYSTSGEHRSFSSIMEEVFSTIFAYFGAPDLIGAPYVSMEGLPAQDGDILARDGGAEVVYAVRRVDAPTVPLSIEVVMDKVKVRDRSDGLRGEFYMYGRVCTNVGREGLTGGVSFSWPAGRHSNCTPERMPHGHKKVWDGDEVAKGVVMARGSIRAVPFIYIEVQGWDEDKENWGDDDDPMGLLTRVVLLDEDNLRWEVDSNRPHLSLEESKRASKVTFHYRVEVG